MFEKTLQVAEGILVGHEVNAKLLAARVELANFLAGQRTPALPDGLVMAVGERVFGIELKFVDLEIGKVLDQFEQCFELGHPAARDVQHHTAPREIRPVADFQTGQTKWHRRPRREFADRRSVPRAHSRIICRNVAVATCKPPISRNKISIPFLEIVSA